MTDADTTTNWEERLGALEVRLADWYRTCREEYERILRERRSWFRKPRAEELDRIEQEARTRAGEDAPRDVARLLDELCALYLKALPGERARIRARVGSHTSVFRFLWSYVESLPDLVRTSADERRFELALAAVSIDDLRTDLADVNAVLGRLWLAAEGAGIDPRPRFESVAAVSNPGTSGGGAHFQEHLRGFERSVYFRSAVDPQRSKAARRAKAS